MSIILMDYTFAITTDSLILHRRVCGIAASLVGVTHPSRLRRPV